MRSPLHSRNWSPSRNSKPLPGWANSSKPSSHAHSSMRGGFDQPPLSNWRALRSCSMRSPTNSPTTPFLDRVPIQKRDRNGLARALTSVWPVQNPVFSFPQSVSGSLAGWSVSDLSNTQESTGSMDPYATYPGGKERPLGSCLPRSRHR